MKYVLLVLFIIAVLYLAAGVFAAWALSSSGGERFSFNGMTIKFVLTWPLFLFGGMKAG